jgi:outer membrane protein OmpA-like peptidoglycan-associated protein
MKINLSILTFVAFLITPSLAQEIIPAKDIAKKLNESVRGGKVEQRTQQFSNQAYKELNPTLEPASRGIAIVPTGGGQQQASVNVDASAAMTFENIRFKIDSIDLADEASARQLVAIAEALKEIGVEKSFVIEGHTCNLGADVHNQKLSERRSLAVGLFFRKQGVKCELVPFGFGEKDPQNANNSEADRQTNRRVVVRRKA